MFGADRGRGGGGGGLGRNGTSVMQQEIGGHMAKYNIGGPWRHLHIYIFSNIVTLFA